MKEGWETLKLGGLCEFLDRRGVTPEKLGSKFFDSGFRVISAINIKGRRIAIHAGEQRFVDEVTYRRWMQSSLRADDVLLTSEAPLGEPAYIDEDLEWCLGQRLFGIRTDKTRLLGRFLFLALQSSDVRNDLLSRATGATAQGIRQSELRQVGIPVPLLPEQQRIVALLDEAFAGLATAKANAEQNLQNARALFESHLQSVFSQRGEGWDEVAIGEVAEVFDGPHATPKTVDEGPIFLGISSLQDGKIDLGETRHVTPEDFQLWTRRVKPQADDVVFSYETRLGQAAVIPPGLDCCLGRRMALVRPSATRLDPTFFVYQYISPPFRAYLEDKIVRGATVDRIPLREFPTYLIYLPSFNMQLAIASQLEAVREETQRLTRLYERKLAALEELKKSLLHQAFNGEL